jgi:gas vesicle protein
MKNKSTKSRKELFTGLLILMIMGTSAFAWARPTRPNQNRQRMREKFETMKMWKIMDALSLDSQTALKLFPIIREMDEKKMRLREKQRDLMRRMDTLSKGTPGSAGDLNTLANQIFDINEQIAALPREEFKKLQGVLSEKQLAQYILFQQRFRKEFIRQWMRNKRNKSKRGSNLYP